VFCFYPIRILQGFMQRCGFTCSRRCQHALFYSTVNINARFANTVLKSCR
jgi:hypothetical protein